MGIDVRGRDGVAEVVIDFPPVNALPTQGWYDLAAPGQLLLTEHDRDRRWLTTRLTDLAVPEPGRTAGKFVLVYDDVCTTGTQLDAVAGCLFDQGGAARVEGVVLARASWRA